MDQAKWEECVGRNVGYTGGLLRSCQSARKTFDSGTKAKILEISLDLQEAVYSAVKKGAVAQGTIDQTVQSDIQDLLRALGDRSFLEKDIFMGDLNSPEATEWNIHRYMRRGPSSSWIESLCRV